ncbi:MAG TPA: F0F1 ATP synthase subunit B [Candidatus Saccharimonadia bacterium]|nr:F0F1 ATP synthase subunit B [Candidatus Saccharimonadia bacterium]
MSITITLVIQGLAFFATVLLVMKYGWPNIMAAIEERQHKIAEGLAAADRARAELKDADVKVADEIRKARSEAQAILEKAHGQYNHIVDQAREDALDEGARRKAAAESEIENLSHHAKDVLRQQVAALAMKGAEKILRREIDGARHRDLLDELAKEI